MAKAVVLLSGGLDSTTTLAIAKGEGFEPYALVMPASCDATTQQAMVNYLTAYVGVTQYGMAPYYTKNAFLPPLPDTLAVVPGALANRDLLKGPMGLRRVRQL